MSLPIVSSSNQGKIHAYFRIRDKICLISFKLKGGLLVLLKIIPFKPKFNFIFLLRNGGKDDYIV